VTQVDACMPIIHLVLMVMVLGCAKRPETAIPTKTQKTGSSKLPTTGTQQALYPQLQAYSHELESDFLEQNGLKPTLWGVIFSARLSIALYCGQSYS
jgi:hypothetical protein